VADLISDGVGATVSDTMRETVSMVEELSNAHAGGVPTRAVAEALKLDRSAVARRLLAAREKGYLDNLEDRRGKPARYQVGEPMPGEVVLLPHSCTPSVPETAGR
jgi:phosphosulfolactate phosphohydrolase-like enzyme